MVGRELSTGDAGQALQPELGVLLNKTGRLLVQESPLGQVRLQGVLQLHHVLHHPRGHLEPLPSPEEAPVLEHIPAQGVQGPVGALARPVGPARDLDKTVVEGQIVTQRVLPTLRVLPVVGEAVHDELVDLAERQHLLGRALNRHSREGYVRIGRLLVAVRLTARSGHDGGRRGRRQATQPTHGQHAGTRPATGGDSPVCTHRA